MTEGNSVVSRQAITFVNWPNSPHFNVEGQAGLLFIPNLELYLDLVRNRTGVYRFSSKHFNNYTNWA